MGDWRIRRALRRAIGHISKGWSPGVRAIRCEISTFGVQEAGQGGGHREGPEA